MLDSLVLLPEEHVAERMTYLRENIPDGSEPLLQYFDNTYVSRSYRQIQPPLRPDGTILPIRTIYMECTHHHLWRRFQNEQRMWVVEQWIFQAFRTRSHDHVKSNWQYSEGTSSLFSVVYWSFTCDCLPTCVSHGWNEWSILVLYVTWPHTLLLIITLIMHTWYRKNKYVKL